MYGRRAVMPFGRGMNVKRQLVRFDVTSKLIDSEDIYYTQYFHISKSVL